MRPLGHFCVPDSFSDKTRSHDQDLSHIESIDKPLCGYEGRDRLARSNIGPKATTFVVGEEGDCGELVTRELLELLHRLL